MIAGAAGRSAGRGAGLGAGIGAAAGLVGVLLTRGPEAILARGSQLEMVFDRDLFLTEQEATFENPLGRSPAVPAGGPQSNGQESQSGGIPGIPRL